MRDTRFADLRSAGRALAHYLDAYAARPQTIVLGIVRGGVPVAIEVANALSLPLDILLLRRLFAPDGPADPLTAAWVAGTFVTDDRLQSATLPVPGGAEFLAEALDTFSARNMLCRGVRAPTAVQGKTILLVDNGVRTGGTMRAAARAVRMLGAKRIVTVAPVASDASRALLHAVADEVVCPVWIERFAHVGMFYDDFAVPHVEQIHGLLAPQIRL
jgi:putative phosphoribosyl transferase